MVQQRVLQAAKERFLFQVTQPAKDFLLREGTNMQYGARHLKRAIERYLTCPLASLLATEQVRLDDVISIDWDGKENSLKFWREDVGALSPVCSQVPEPIAQAAVAGSDSRGLTLPALKIEIAENPLADGNVSTAIHKQSRQRAIVDQPKPKTQVERALVISSPHS